MGAGEAHIVLAKGKIVLSAALIFLGSTGLEMGLPLCYTGENGRRRGISVGRVRGELEQRLDEETEARITRMEQEDYSFPRRFSKGDYLLWGVVTGASLLLVILGARL